MKLYTVRIKETNYYEIEIEANNSVEAEEKAECKCREESDIVSRDIESAVVDLLIIPDNLIKKGSSK